MVLLPGCSGSAASDGPTAQSASAGAAPSPSDSPSDEGELAIHGSWRLEQTEADIRAALVQSGFGDYADAFLREEDITDVLTQVLTVKGDRFAFAYLSEGQPWHVGWKGPATITPDAITLRDTFTGSQDQLSWTVEGDELRFQVLQAAPGSFKGIPNEAFHRAYLTAAPFVRTTCQPQDRHCDA